MSKMELKKFMSFRKEGKIHTPLAVFIAGDQAILAVYQGSISKYDILVKYRQKRKSGEWSRLRTPKHIHWAVDLLIKMHSTDKKKIQEFLDFLIEIWNQTTPMKDFSARKKLLDLKTLLDQKKVKEYQSISEYGEYRMEFLILLGKLLMLQEKTNREDAYMFKRLLEALKKGEDIFSIVSTASHVGR